MSRGCIPEVREHLLDIVKAKERPIEVRRRLASKLMLRSSIPELTFEDIPSSFEVKVSAHSHGI